MTIREFILTYYKQERRTRYAGQTEDIIANRERDMRELGEARISRHESVTGQAIVLNSHFEVAD